MAESSKNDDSSIIAAVTGDDIIFSDLVISSHRFSHGNQYSNLIATLFSRAFQTSPPILTFSPLNKKMEAQSGKLIPGNQVGRLVVTLNFNDEALHVFGTDEKPLFKVIEK